MKKIQGINVAHFSNGAHYEFHEYVLQMVKACSAITGETKYLTNLADEYEAALAVEKKYEIKRCQRHQTMVASHGMAG